MDAPARERRSHIFGWRRGERVTERFRNQAQQQAVCDRILRLAHYNLETVRSELLHHIDRWLASTDAVLESGSFGMRP